MLPRRSAINDSFSLQLCWERALRPGAPLLHHATGARPVHQSSAHVHAVHAPSGLVRVQGSDTRGREGAVVLVQGRGRVHASGDRPGDRPGDKAGDRPGDRAGDRPSGENDQATRPGMVHAPWREAGPPNHHGGSARADAGATGGAGFWDAAGGGERGGSAERVSRVTEREAEDLEELGEAAAGQSPTRNLQS